MFRLSKAAFLAVLSASVFSCTQMSDLYQGTKQEQKDRLSGTEYAKKFSNFTEINVNITSELECGRVYSIYPDQPYDSLGSIVEKPLLTARTPIEATIPIPNGVDSLYVLTSNKMAKYPVADLTISDKSSVKSSKATSRSGNDDIMTTEEMNKAVEWIENVYLPEVTYNVKKEDLYKCTDLAIKDLLPTQKARIWSTFISDGSPIGLTFGGYFWYYTYTKPNPNIEDCHFWGKVGDEITSVTFDDIKNKKKWLYNTKTSERKVEMELANETFVNDTYVGFVYVGNMGPRFSTPSLNTPENCDCEEYIGETFNYDDNDSITLEDRINSGVMFHFESLGSQYNVIGMENRLPHQSTEKTKYDADYNDCIVLIRSNPETLAPLETVAPPNIVYTTTREGIWLFEDNYPDDGDFDFNDIVVAYQMQQVGNMIKVNCQLLATGCSFSNEVGLMLLPNTTTDAWKNPIKTETLWDNVSGYKNVYKDNFDLSNCEKKSVSFVSTSNNTYLIRPYLNTVGKGRFTFETYNTGNYPYALDIPTWSNKSNARVNTCFRWMLEGSSLDDGYKFLDSPRSATWFFNSAARDTTLLVPRDKDFNIWE